MTEQQRAALEALCQRYHVPFRETDYHPTFELPDGWVAGLCGRIYVGVSPEGHVHS